MKKIKFILLFSLFMFALVVEARAHRLILFSYEKDGEVTGEAYFAGGHPCRDCPVEIYDSSQQLIAGGKADDSGQFALDHSHHEGEVEVRVSDGRGHQAHRQLKISEPRYSSDKEFQTSASDTVLARIAALEEEVRQLRGVVQPDIVRVAGGLGYILGIAGLLWFLLPGFSKRNEN